MVPLGSLFLYEKQKYSIIVIIIHEIKLYGSQNISIFFFFYLSLRRVINH
jgi:hypothetical protein